MRGTAALPNRLGSRGILGGECGNTYHQNKKMALSYRKFKRAEIADPETL
jgi:hypothetical protein